MSNKSKEEQLGMPIGTASARLKKSIMLNLIKKLSQNICYRCNKKIRTPEELSIDHIKNWLHKSPKLFWDLNNITFSHRKCNKSERTPRTKKKHGANAFRRGCRCFECRKIIAQTNKRYRNKIRASARIG